ncbi:Protein kinase, membrane associated tyrosine threonine 1 [Geranomyces variabilis]|nr:Protein kinase, membrane associated tyrosine threonine 1 [Geranomyces variabilis]
MEDVVVAAQTPSRKLSSASSLTPPSSKNHASVAAEFPGPFRLAQAPHRQSSLSLPSGTPHGSASASKSQSKSFTFATPAPPKRRVAGSHVPLRPSALPRPIRPTRSSFNLSSLSDHMDGDEDASSQSTPSEGSQNSPWSAFGTPNTPALLRAASQNSARNSRLLGRGLTETPTAGPAFDFGTESADKQTPVARFPHERLDSTYSEPDILQADRFGSTFFTPQQKLVKPNPAAFHSTGLLSRKGRPLANEQQTFTMPETPLKKGATPALAFNRRGEAFAPKALAPAAAFEPSTPTSHQPPTPSRYPAGSVASKHYRSPLQDSPSKTSKKPHLNADGSPLGGKAFLQLASPVPNRSGTPGRRKLGLPPPGTPSARGGTASSSFASLSSQNDDWNGSPPSAAQKSALRLNCALAGSARSWKSGSAPSWGAASDADSPFTSSAPVGGSEPVQQNHGDADMMDCDPDFQTPTTNGPPRIVSFTMPQLGINPLITSYPLFLTPQFFVELHARKGRPPEADKSHGAGVHSDHLEQNFRITERLGRGSFAEAFKVQSKVDGRCYAIKKTIHPFTGYKDGLNKMSEVDVLWHVGSHPYCVGLMAAWVQYGYMYLQMELCEAGSLDAYLEDNCRDSSLEEYRIWHILAEIAQGLKHIQDLGLVHLDLKPANIFITRTGALKIGDFGLAARAPVSNHDDREGDRTYIAPEIMKAPTFGKPADVFSLGLIILEITANVILPENGPYWHKLREGDLGEIDFGQEISPALVDLVKSMLDPDPDMRPTVDGILGHPYVAQVCAAHAPLGALSVVDPQASGL